MAIALAGLPKQRPFNHKPEQLKMVHDWPSAFETFWALQLDRIRERAEQLARDHFASSRFLNLPKGEP